MHCVVMDLHAEHLLFTGESLTGIIDYGAARVDSPVGDLVRMLGSLEPFNAQARHQAFEYYRVRNQCDALPLEQFRLIDEISTLLSALQWLEWLVWERRTLDFDTTQRAVERWQRFVERLAQNAW